VGVDPQPQRNTKSELASTRTFRTFPFDSKKKGTDPKARP
jgi:hypothetical protein